MMTDSEYMMRLTERDRGSAQQPLTQKIARLGRLLVDELVGEPVDEFGPNFFRRLAR